jgi:SAM-dependent methyltransferase
VTQDKNEYVLGTHDAELARLGLQHDCWRAQAYALWERAGFAPGHVLLDVGAGPGFATRDLARIVGPTGRVLAAEISDRYADHIDKLGIPNVSVIKGDLLALELPEKTLHGAYARWVFSFVKDPLRVASNVARAMRPGGTFVLQEYVRYESMRLCPRGDAFAPVVRAVIASWKQTGGDAEIGIRLPGILEEAGFEIVDLRPQARIARPGTLLWDWPGSFFPLYAPTLVERGLLSEAERRAFEDEWRDASLDPSSFFYCPVVLEIVARKK